MSRENYLPERVQERIARLRARSKSGTQSGAEKCLRHGPGDNPGAFDRASVTALGANAPFRIEIDSPKAGLKMDVRTEEQRRFVHRFIREVFDND